jgi:hypothetical protein
VPGTTDVRFVEGEPLGGEEGPAAQVQIRPGRGSEPEGIVSFQLVWLGPL